MIKYKSSIRNFASVKKFFHLVFFKLTSFQVKFGAISTILFVSFQRFLTAFCVLHLFTK